MTWIAKMPRVVLDTNTLLRALVNSTSASGRVVDACEFRHIRVLLSADILREYYVVLGDADLQARFSGITDEAIERILGQFQYLGEYHKQINLTFRLDRDPEDAKFIELAIAGHATHIISHDKDLLSLPTSRSEAGKRFRQRLPGVKVQDAAVFVRENPRVFRE